MNPVPSLTTPLLQVPVAAMRAPVDQGQTRPLAWRLSQLQRLEALLEEAREPLLDALAADLGKHPLEATFELVAIEQELRLTRRRLRRWMAPRPQPLPLWALPGRAWLEAEPLGCVLIIGPWNYPFQLSLHPLVSALAAGNSAVVKPSEHAPHCAELIARLVKRHFPAEIVQVVTGDGAVAAQLLQERFDHIFFTGGGRVGRLVLAAAAPQLTPVTLELGGKSPAIVLEGADIAVTARRLAWGKWINAGQTCVAPDHILVTPALRQPLIDAIASEWSRFHGDDPLASPHLGSIVNAGQFQRLERLLAGARRNAQVLVGGRSDAGARRIEPTLIQVAEPTTDPLMQEELFGPLLPLITVATLEEALAQVRRGGKPLALYLFGGDGRARRQVRTGSSSGSLVFNDVVVQAGLAAMPFGGVGESGMGRYHGESGFLTFSNLRSVLSRPFQLDLPFRYPPYNLQPATARRLLR